MLNLAECYFGAHWVIGNPSGKIMDEVNIDYLLDIDR